MTVKQVQANFHSATDQSCLELMLFLMKDHNLMFYAADNNQV